MKHTWDVCIDIICSNTQCVITQCNRAISATATVIGITPITYETHIPNDDNAKIDAADHDGDYHQNLPCTLCGMISAPEVGEAKGLPKPM